MATTILAAEGTEGRVVAVRAAYRAEWAHEAKGLGGRWWPASQAWLVPADREAAVREAVARLGLEPAPERRHPDHDAILAELVAQPAAEQAAWARRLMSGIAAGYLHLPSGERLTGEACWALAEALLEAGQ